MRSVGDTLESSLGAGLGFDVLRATLALLAVHFRAVGLMGKLRATGLQRLIHAAVNNHGVRMAAAFPPWAAARQSREQTPHDSATVRTAGNDARAQLRAACDPAEPGSSPGRRLHRRDACRLAGMLGSDDHSRGIAQKRLRPRPAIGAQPRPNSRLSSRPHTRFRAGNGKAGTTRSPVRLWSRRIPASGDHATHLTPQGARGMRVAEVKQAGRTDVLRVAGFIRVQALVTPEQV